MPDPRLVLLDGSDFYDVAQDEFNCFSPKKKPTCPDDHMTEIVLGILAGLTILFVIHDYFQKPDKDDIGCINE